VIQNDAVWSFTEKDNLIEFDEVVDFNCNFSI